LIPSFKVAQEGRFSRISPGQSLPFDAWCFDDVAMARVKATIEYASKNCELKTNMELAKQKADFNLKIDNLQIRYDTLKKSSEEILAIKNQEIENLEQAALKRPNDYSYFWFGGGTAVGILTTLAVVYAVK
jgi:hypothetical protein